MEDAFSVPFILSWARVIPLFYIQTLQYWFEFKDMQDKTKPGIKNTILGNNKDIKIDNNTIFFRTWVSRGVSTIENLLDHNLDLITYEEFKTRYQIKTNFFDLLRSNKRYSKWIQKIYQTNKHTIATRTTYTATTELESTNNQGYT